MRKSILTSLCLLLFVSGLAHALPIEVANFATDPSNGQFTIQPVALSDPGSINLDALPTLEYGVTSVPDNTLNTMSMSWEQETENQDAQAGWELVFGTDPDIRNQQIILSINPPGGWTDGNGQPFPGPPPANPPPPGPYAFQGIKSLEVRAIDNNVNPGSSGWGFNTDQDNSIALVNDPNALGLSSLANNFMQTVTINVGPAGPVAGSASIAGGPGGPFTCPNFITTGANGAADFTKIVRLQFFENGILQAGINVIPGQPAATGLINYWDHVTVTPEPVTLLVLALGGAAVLLRKRRA